MHKISRISYNSEGWRKPTGEASKCEVGDTYNRKYGFGHEDWLFRTEWLIDDWRYAFIQGVNKSHVRLVKAGQAIDLTLFTIHPDNKKRRLIASIYEVECLDNQQADDALIIFRERGWYDTMLQEVQAVGGNASALGDTEWVKYILNVRFRQKNVHPFPPDTYATPGDPIYRMTRYQLYDAKNNVSSNVTAPSHLKAGATSLPKIQSFMRRGSASVECTPEHAHMQEKLMKELKDENPTAIILREQDYIDVSVQTENELILFEIKSDIDPTTVIRTALGQILEYAYHPNRTHLLPVRLVIVGRRPLSQLDETYLDYLRTEFYLPLSYRVVEL